MTNPENSSSMNVVVCSPTKKTNPAEEEEDIMSMGGSSPDSDRSGTPIKPISSNSSVTGDSEEDKETEMSPGAKANELKSVIENNTRRLNFLLSELGNVSSFKRAAMELGLWCKDSRAYLPETEDVLFECIEMIRKVCPQKGFNLMLGWYVLCIVTNFRTFFKKQKNAERIGIWFKEVSKLVTIYRNVMRPCPSTTVSSCREGSVTGSLTTPFSTIASQPPPETPSSSNLTATTPKYFRPLSSPIEPCKIDLNTAVLELPSGPILFKLNPEHNQREFSAEFEIKEDESWIGASSSASRRNDDETNAEALLFSQSSLNGRQVKFYCAWSNEDIAGANFEWPCDIAVCFNGVNLRVERKHMVHVTVQNRIAVFGVDLPCNFTPYLKVGTNSIRVAVRNCCCAMDFYVQVFEPVKAKELVAQVKAKEPFPETPASTLFSHEEDEIVREDDTKEKVDDDINGNSNSNSANQPSPKLVSLLCPFSNQKLVTPVRSIKCQHLACFDLNAYLIYNRSVLQWRCPVCNIKAPIEDLRVDTFMESIVKNMAFKENQVLVYPDGMFAATSSLLTPMPAAMPASSPFNGGGPSNNNFLINGSGSNNSNSNVVNMPFGGFKDQESLKRVGQSECDDIAPSTRKLLKKSSLAKLKIDTSASGSATLLAAAASSASSLVGSMETPSTAQFKNSILTPTTLNSLQQEMEKHATENEPSLKLTEPKN